MQGARVQSLVGVLGSHKPKKKNTPRHKTEKQYCNKFNKDLKMDHIEKNLKKENQKLSARGGWKGEADFMWHGLPWVE